MRGEWRADQTGGRMSATGVTNTHGLWPVTEAASHEQRPARTLRSTIGFHSFVLLAVISFFAIVFLAVR